MLRVDPYFIPAYQLQLLKGRNFSLNFPSDKQNAVVLTMRSLRLFGFKNEDDALKGAINLEGQGDKKFQVIGVIKDFHQLSPKEDFTPLILTMFNPWNSLDINFISVKLHHTSPGAIVSKIGDEFRAVFPGSSFDSFFLDEYFSSQYLDDLKYGSIITTFTWLALLIVCLGIFGVSRFMLIKRTKEIAIRKIVGAGHAPDTPIVKPGFPEMYCSGICIRSACCLVGNAYLASKFFKPYRNKWMAVPILQWQQHWQLQFVQ